MRTGDGDRLREQKFSELKARPWYRSALVLLPCAALVYFAYRRETVGAFTGPLVALLVVWGAGWWWADSWAKKEVMRRFAAARGFVFHEEFDPPPYTPLLRAGDKRDMGCAMERDGVLLAHYTYTEVHHNGKGGTSEDDHEWTVATTAVEPAMLALPSLYLQPGGKGGWVKRGNLRECDTESIIFNDRFEVLCREDQDDLVLRRFLDPSNLQWLLDHPLGFGVEISAGQLLVYIEDHADDSGVLSTLLDVLVEVRRMLYVAARIEVSAPAPASHAPPAG